MPVPAPPPPGAPWPPPAPPAGGPDPRTWPSGSPLPPPGKGPGGRRGRPGIGVLASVGGAALVALTLAATVIIIRAFPDPTPAGRTGGTFRMAVPSPGTPDEEIAPSHVFGGTARFVAKQLFTGLTELGADGAMRNRLATRITPDGTCTRWEIGIRGGTTFSNGEPVDARAFARGWNRSAATESGSGAYLMTDIQGFTEVAGGDAGELSGVEAVSGDLLEVTLTSPNCDFPRRLSEPAFMPVPEGAGEPENESFNTRPVGNGPYTLDEHRTGSGISLARNDGWAFGKTKFDAVEITFSDDAAKGRAAYSAGEVDWYSGSTDELSSVPREELVTRASPFTRMLVPLTARGPMESREARLAVSHALDRARLGEVVGGLHRPAHGIVSAAVPGFGEPGPCPSCEKPDPAKAKELAEQAGLGPGTEINLYLRESPVYDKLAEAVQGALESTLGWKVEKKTTPLSDFEKFRETLVSEDASGLAVFAWGPDYPGAYSMLWPLLGGSVVATGGNSHYNYSGWKNDRFDDLMSRAVRTPDAGARAGLYKEAEKVALDDMALVPLVYDGYAAVVRKDKYVGLQIDYDGDPTVATAAFK